MDKPFCLICKKPRNTDLRAKYCCDKHRWRLVAARRGGVGPDPAPPPASLPAEAEEILPLGAAERLLIATQLALVAMAPAGVRGYRVGPKTDSRS